MEVRKGYKHTEVGIIPEDWEVTKLGGIADIKTGPFGSSLHEKDYVRDGTPIITVEHLGEQRIVPENMPMVSDLDRKRLSSYSMQTNDIVFSRVGSVDRNSIVTEKENGWLFSGRLLRIRINSKNILPKYLSFYFHQETFKQRIRSVAVGQTMPSLNTQILKGIEVGFPPTKSEQTAIATALSDADALISSLEKLIEKKRNIKQGAMQQLLTPKKGWEVKKLGEIAEIVGGGTPSSFVPKYWNGTINWFTPTEIGKNKYTYESVRKITKDGLSDCSARILPIGTILLTSRAGIGDLSILKTEGCTNQGFQSLISKEGYYNEYLYYLMQTLKGVLIQNASGSTFLEISPNKIKQIEVHLPSFQEQTQIATILSDLDTEITALEKKLTKSKMLKQGMMQELLTGKIRLQ